MKWITYYSKFSERILLLFGFQRKPVSFCYQYKTWSDQDDFSLHQDGIKEKFNLFLMLFNVKLDGLYYIVKIGAVARNFVNNTTALAFRSHI